MNIPDPIPDLPSDDAYTAMYWGLKAQWVEWWCGKLLQQYPHVYTRQMIVSAINILTARHDASIMDGSTKREDVLRHMDAILRRDDLGNLTPILFRHYGGEDDHS